MTATHLLSAGAILPAGTAGDPELPGALPVDRLDARIYRHGVLAHPVVRLVPAALAPGEDLVMDYLGCGAPGVAAGVGERARRAPGFPGWALIHDPAHARHALEVVKRMKAAGRRIRSKVGQAWDAFTAIADELGRSTAHFLPSFWEEAGRMFGDAGNVHYAGRAFAKAREAEKVHALDVDLAALRESFLEFSLRGAVSVKAIGDFARTLALGRAGGPAVAWAAFRDLALRRCRGGLPPWAGMLGELRALAGAAKLDRHAAAAALLAELMPLPAASRVKAAFWEEAEKELALLARDPAHVRMLLEFLPAPVDHGNAFAWWWVERLQAWGLTAHAVAGRLPDGNAFAGGPWFARLVRHALDGARIMPAADCAFDLLPALAPALRASGPLLPYGAGNGHADLDLVHLALELEVPLGDPPAGLRFDLVGWADSWSGRRPVGDALPAPHPCRRRDPVAVHADPRFRPALEAGIVASLDMAMVQGRLASHPTILAVARGWLAGVLDRAGGRALPAVELAVEAINRCASPAVQDAMPGLAARLADFTVAPALARTIVTGLPDEFGWPALEAAIIRLTPGSGGARFQHAAVELDGLPPVVVARNSTHATVIGPGGVLLEHDFQLPAGARVRSCLWLDGQLLVQVTGSDWVDRWAYWSGAPGQRVAADDHHAGFFGNWGADLPGLGTSVGGRAVRAGESAPKPVIRPLFGDGRSWWIMERGRDGLAELDPVTGDIGRRSLPAWFEAGLVPGWTLDLHASHLLPVGVPTAGAPLATRTGLGGVRVLRGPGGSRIEDCAGTAIDLPATAQAGRVAVARWPGADDARVLWDGGHHPPLVGDARGEVTWKSDARTRRDQRGLPLLHWYRMVPREPSASARLRACGAADGEALLAAVTADRVERKQRAATGGLRDDGFAPGQDPVHEWPATAAAVAARFGVADPRLLLAVVALAVDAERMQRELRGRSRLSAPPPPPAPTAELRNESMVRDGAVHLLSVGVPTTLPAATALAGIVPWLLATAGAPPPRHWLTWWGDHEVFRYNLSHALRSPNGSERALSAAFLRALAAAGFDRLPGACRVGRVAWDAERPPLTLELHRHGDAAVGALREGGGSFIIRVADRGGSELFEYAPEGGFRGLAAVPFISTTADIALPPPPAFLRAAAGCLDGRCAPDLDAALLARAATALDDTPAVAALLLLGRAQFDSRAKSCIPEPQRVRLKLAVRDVAEARERIAKVDPAVLRALAAALLGDDPAGMWAPETAGPDGRSPLERLAAVWRGMPRRAMPLQAVPTIDRHLPEFTRGKGPLPDLLAGLGAGRPPFIPLADTIGATAPRRHGMWGGTANGPGELVAAMLLVAAGCQLDLPSGDPFAARLAAAVPHLAQHLADQHLAPELVAIGPDPQTELRRACERLRNELGAAGRRTVRRGDGVQVEVVDDGGLFAVAGHGDLLVVHWRPAGCLTIADHQRLVALSALAWGEAGASFAVQRLAWIRRWRDPAVQRLLATLATSPVPAGRHAADPRASAPAAVAAAMARHGLSEDAATAYLQILALPEPRTADVARWNGWDARRTAAAFASAVGAGLLLSAQRKGAGREVFLPGGWETDGTLSAPLETWKLPLFGIVRGRQGRLEHGGGPLLPYEPLGELFARAWQRVVDGDAPRYEEVR